MGAHERRAAAAVADQPARIRELSRMLAGLEDSEFGQAHAEELLAMAAHERDRDWPWED